jgi:small subunit ribosomal protein S16
MVKIRLSRGGAKKRPFYHIVATDHRSKRDGRSLERLGFYNPVAQGNEQRVVLDTARINHWVSQGAQLTDKVRMLVKEVSSQAASA